MISSHQVKGRSNSMVQSVTTHKPTLIYEYRVQHKPEVFSSQFCCTSLPTRITSSSGQWAIYIINTPYIPSPPFTEHDFILIAVGLGGIFKFSSILQKALSFCF